MKTKIFSVCCVIVVAFTLSSFTANDILGKNKNHAEDTGNCNINFTLTGATNGCTVSVSGTVDCNALILGNGMSTFSGTIVFGGPTGCNQGTVTVAYAIPNGTNGWSVPNGYSIAFYKVGSNSDCNTTEIKFIGSSDSKVSFLNSLSKAFLDEMKKDLGC